MSTEKRKMQLIGREGMISHLLETYDFPTDTHRSIIELIHEETLAEINALGLKSTNADKDQFFEGYDERKQEWLL